MADLLATLGIAPGEELRARGRAANDLGFGPRGPSPTAGSGSIVAAQAPQAKVGSPRGVTIRKNCLTISWDALALGADQGFSTVTSYDVFINAGGAAAFDTTPTATPTAETVELCGLTEGTAYNMKIRAVNLYGAGIDSDTLTLTTSQVPTKPDAPTVQVSGTQVSLSWDPTTSDGGTGGVTSAAIKILDSTAAWTEFTSICPATDTSVTSCAVAMEALLDTTGLEPGANIKAVLATTNADGTSPDSDPNADGTLAQGAPTAAPTDFAVDSFTKDTITVSWTSVAAGASAGYADLTDVLVYATTPGGSVPVVT